MERERRWICAPDQEGDGVIDRKDDRQSRPRQPDRYVQRIRSALEKADAKSANRGKRWHLSHKAPRMTATQPDLQHPRQRSACCSIQLFRIEADSNGSSPRNHFTIVHPGAERPRQRRLALLMRARSRSTILSARLLRNCSSGRKAGASAAPGGFARSSEFAV